MWKIPVFAMILATMFLGGCNWGDEANEETPMEDVGNDIREGVNDVEDAVTPDTNNDVYDRDANGVDNNGTVNDNGIVPEVRDPNSNIDGNGTNNNNGTVNEDNIEDNAEVRERENINTR